MKALTGSVAMALVLSTGLAYGQAALERKDQSTAPANELHKQGASPEHSQVEKLDSGNKLSQQEKAKTPDEEKAPASKSAEQTKPEDQRATSKAASERSETPNSKGSAENTDKAGKAPNHADAQKPADKSDMSAQRSHEPRKDNNREASENHDTSAVSIDAQKQTRIQESLRTQHVENISHVDFSIRVGDMVPDRYHFNPLPETVVALVPEYRGYEYIMVDNEIVIIEPSSRKIVYTMQEGRSASMDHRSVDCK